MPERPNAEHEFGGVSTNLKLSIVEQYLHAFTTALRPQFRQLIYIDAFAGTGERTVRQGADPLGVLGSPDASESIQRLRGSAQIAIDTDPRFDKLTFIDNNPVHCRALRALRDTHPERDIVVEEGDATVVLDRLLSRATWAGCRGVLFLDPYGMSVPWETLVSIRRTEALDTWYLVSLAGLYRQAARNKRALTEEKRAAITRMLGYDGWESEWYGELRQTTLFGDVDEQEVRVVDVTMIEETVAARLKSLFPAIGGPLRLLNDRRQPMASLFFLPSNPKRVAVGLAMRIATHILNSGMLSHRRPR